MTRVTTRRKMMDNPGTVVGRIISNTYAGTQFISSPGEGICFSARFAIGKYQFCSFVSSGNLFVAFRLSTDVEFCRI